MYLYGRCVIGLLYIEVLMQVLNEVTHVTPYKLSGPSQPHILTYKCIHVIGSHCMFAVYHGTMLGTGDKTGGRQILSPACGHGGICMRMIR